MKKLLYLLVVAAAWLLLTGESSCNYNRYTVELEPANQEIVRTLTCARIEPSGSEEKTIEFDAHELGRIASVYAERLSKKDAGVHRFRDRFLQATPQDVGGAGRYVYLTSLMGSFGAYSERFRGNDDQAGQLRKAGAALDRLVDHLRGWARAELGAHPGMERLDAFLHGTLRRDLHNLILYTALAERLNDYDEDATEEMGFRAAHLLVERGYLRTGQLRAWSSAWHRALVDEEAPALMAMIARLVAGWMGVADTDPLPAELGFLATAQKAEASFHAYLKTTPAYKKKHADWQARKANVPDLHEPGAESVVIDDFSDLVLFEVGPHDRLDVRLSIPVEAFATNGSWDAAGKQVTWKNRELKKRVGLPAYLYALWSEPAEAFQKKHFGKVLLTGRGLAEYVMWRQGLSEQEGIAWDDFLRKLEPGEGMLEKVGAFRFPGEKKQGLVETPLRLIGATQADPP
jgi:hypothetical protein